MSIFSFDNYSTVYLVFIGRCDMCERIVGVWWGLRGVGVVGWVGVGLVGVGWVAGSSGVAGGVGGLIAF